MEETISQKEQQKSESTTSIEVVEVSPSQQIENLNAIFEAMKQMTQELKKDIGEMRQQNKHDILELRKNIEEGNQRMYEKIWKGQKQIREELADFKERTQTEVEKVQKELVETKREVEQRIKGIENATPISVERIVEERKPPIYDASNKGIEPQEFFEALERHFKIRAMPEDRKLDFAIYQLKDDVAIWAGSQRNQWTTLEDHKRELLKMKWSDSVQKRVLSQFLRPGMYSPGRRSMTHHAWYWLKKYAAEMDFVEEKIKFQYNEEILNLPRIRNNEEEDGQELTRPQFASQEHNDIIATQTDHDDILKFDGRGCNTYRRKRNYRMKQIRSLRSGWES
ncbi:hypothetical protein QE152_g25317 [Popillia japonica]|uniref:Retrotransposon gag domain-containing protein n=1 Tax=Popillia japonica TaxID=7064 RepID=A0AAW1K1G2_POPJA